MSQICEDCTVTDQVQADQRRVAMLRFAIRQAREDFRFLLNVRMSVHKFHDTAENQMTKLTEILHDSNEFSNVEFMAKYKGLGE